MKKRPQFQVRKRDGRSEWLRASKLARSIHLALCAVSDGEESTWRALELSATVLIGIKSKRDADAGSGSLRLTTEELANATQQVLVATGFGDVASAYLEAGAEKRRRQTVLRSRSFFDGAVVGEDFGSLTPSPTNRCQGPQGHGDENPPAR